MAKILNKIKFGTSGETYYVNEYPVQISGELAEDSETIDFGTFDGVTELNLVVNANGLESSGNYFYMSINGVQLEGFITGTAIYNGLMTISLKKIAGIWNGRVDSIDINESNRGNLIKRSLAVLAGADSITSVSFKCYAGTPFIAGCKYALEGR